MCLSWQDLFLIIKGLWRNFNSKSKSLRSKNRKLKKRKKTRKMKKKIQLWRDTRRGKKSKLTELCNKFYIIIQ